MKKKSFVIIAALVVLASVSIYIYTSKSKLSTVNQGERAFAFKDTAAITKIFIADKEGDQSAIVRTKNGWVVNNKYNCRPDAVLNLLEVIKNIEVKMAVPKQGRESVLKFLASNAMKVEIYAGDDLVKQYYVGHESPDNEGSYMLLTNVRNGKNYENPFLCFIPGFNGYLKPRYIAKENEWRDRLVINFTPPQIKQIKVQHFEMPADSSFTIDLDNTTTFKLSTEKNQNMAFDEAKMKQYLVYFQNISYEALITNANKKLQDSLSLVQPFSVITITTTDNKTYDYKFYRKQFSGEENPELGVKYDYDPDRLYLRFDKDSEWAAAQYYVFGKLFMTSAYFLPQATVKK